MTGVDIAAEVASALAEAGAETGDGTALTATITRITGADETVYPPVAGSPEDYTATAVVGQYSARDRDGTNITSRDVKISLAVPLADSLGNETTPQNGDTMAISDGREYHVQNVDALQPGGVVIKWTIQARAAE